MKPAHRVIVRACSLLAGHSGACIIGLALAAMASFASPAWGQSTWPSYPNNNAISVTSGGNVGIGTAAPWATLVTSSPQGVYPAASLTHQSVALWEAGIAYGPGLAMFSAGSPNYGVVLQTRHQTVDGYSWPLSLNPLGGNVGIGTTNPQHSLQVAGTIGAEEVLVTSTGADYVFRPDYRLQPLSEVAAYIQANHHLPDIPSEAEVKQKGMGVGEMEAKLLAKVEELTLHMIQAEKKNQELRDRLARLEKGAATVTTTAAK